MTRYTVALVVHNQFGVLNRLTSMFRRRQFNISAIAASETETPEFSRIIFSFDGEEEKKEQLINQLYKLPDVCSIKELNDENSVNCELMLIKMKNEASSRNEIKSAAEAFGAQTMDYSKDSFVLCLIGTHQRIDDFLELMRDFKILEICRTGTASLQKGSTTLIQNLNI